jgi:hypothetical protein
MKLNDKPIELDSEEFEATVHDLVDEYDLHEIIETGTYLGTGSTLAFAKTGLSVTSLECVKGNVEVARKNLADYENVTVLHATSLSMSVMLEAIVAMAQREYPDHIRCDVRDPENFYTCEIDHEVEYEGLLEELIDTPTRQLIFLDSSGGVGYEEAKLVISMCKGEPKLLMFDDIDHVKHFYTADLLKKEGLDVNISSDGRFAWSWLRG